MGVIRVLGADAASFLQGQLTQDVALLGTGRAPLAAYCNAKGRMQASFIVVKRSPEEVLLICGRDSVAPMVKRLGLFVLRAKVKLSDATADYRMVGLTGTAQQVAAAARAYRVVYAKVNRPEMTQYLMDHSSFIYLVGPDGRVRSLFRPETAPEAIAQAVRGQLRGG
jgi:folate-binding Fe-S cluster repair protein YgfZ